MCLELPGKSTEGIIQRVIERLFRGSIAVKPVILIESHHAGSRIIGVLEITHQGNHSLDTLCLSDQQCLVGYDVVPVGTLTVLFRIGKQGFGYLGRLAILPHHDGDIP